MKNFVGCISVLLAVAGAVAAQVSPRPVAEAEIRDNSSIRMRSLQLERVKRDSKKVSLSQPTKEQLVNIAEIKDDFENIQKNQSKIVNTYRTGKTINYAKIAELAAGISRKATRLDSNLFGAKPEKETATENSPQSKPKSVRDLIIELDRAIGDFVTGPVFESDKLVDTNASAKSESDLVKIIRISNALSVAARKFL